MSIACQHKVAHGPQFCTTDCPVNAPCGVFYYHRVERPEDLPAADERIIDIALLDMNHGWANLGHDSLVHLVQDASCDILGALEHAGLALRVLSFDVRSGGVVPEAPNGRFSLYLGSGGPGHIVPRENDGISEGSQGIRENPTWEQPVFELFNAILADDRSALLGVCHTFGVLCCWSGIATPTLRSSQKGGKSTGILENVLTREGQRHPWFRNFSGSLSDGQRLRIVDNRLYDLIPTGVLPEGVKVIGHETVGVGGPRGDSITMVEWARDRGGVMPRMFASNHHPEIVDRARQSMILQRKHDRGEVSTTWYEERLEILTRNYPDEDSEKRLALTSDFTLVAPLRFHLFRQVRLRARALGRNVPIHEDQLLETYGQPQQASARTTLPASGETAPIY